MSDQSSDTPRWHAGSVCRYTEDNRFERRDRGGSRHNSSHPYKVDNRLHEEVLEGGTGDSVAKPHPLA